MDNLKFIFRLYFAPAAAMSDIMDRGSWLFAAGVVLVVSIAFFGTINTKLESAYHIPNINEFYQPNTDKREDPAEAKAAYDRSASSYNDAMAKRNTIPLIGDRFFQFFYFEPAKFYYPLLLLSVFYIPAATLLMCVIGGAGSFGLVLRRDYGTLAACTLNAWAAAHLPFALAGVVLFTQSVDAVVYLGLWAVSGLVFGIFMIFALRTVFGANYGHAILIVALAWGSMSLGMYVVRFAGPWLFSPFLIFFVIMYLGGFLGGEVRGFGNAFRRKQNLKRFLHNATVNPKDADAHVQLGIIYLQRRQESQAMEHLHKAIEIDKNEIDANYELGKIARSNGDLQAALDHFGIVVEQNDKYALSEIWREIGATYLAANMLDEAHDALEKFVERRAFEVEGLYYFGKVLKAEGKIDRAHEMFKQAIEASKTSPDYRRRAMKQWVRLAQKELHS